MKTRRSVHATLSLAVLAALAAIWFTPARLRAADEVMDQMVPREEATAAELSTLATAGRFDRVLASLRAADPTLDTPGTAALVREIERYEKNRDAQAAKQREAYQKAYDNMVKSGRAGRLEEAVFTGLLARDLAGDKAAFLRDPEVTDLIKRTEIAAAQAEQQDDWVEALSLYRNLDDLFDDYATFHGRYKRAGRHVRVLRLYATDELERLLRQRAERLRKSREAADAEKVKEETTDKVKDPEGKQEKPDEINLDKEPWQQRLADVEPAMLKQALGRAAQRHVNNRGFPKLIRGSIDALLILADTEAVAETFPTLRDKARVTRFREQLQGIAREVGAGDPEMGFLDASSTLDRILAVNARTLDLPQAVIVYEMTEGAIDTLDEFSAVIWPHEKESFARNFQGKFYGVGIQISERDGRLLVVSPLEGTPAQRAGIKAGDIIAKVNARDTAGWSLDQAVREITGEEGTPVTLGIERTGVKGVLDFALKRAEIPIESIRGWQHRASGGWDYYIDPELKIGYVRLSQFIPQSADDLDAAINQMEREGGVSALILDLRFNPGGLLSSAVDIANRFVASGPIVSTVGPDNSKQSEFKARAERAHPPLPTVVLINQGSASASEIVSGALQDHGKALIVGTRSFGKGSVQDVFGIPPSNPKAYLKLTTQYYKLPAGRILHRNPEDKTWGVEPDLTVPVTTEQIADAIEFRQKADVIRDADAPEDAKNPVPKMEELLEKGIDPQLETALLVLKTKLVAKRIALARGR